MKPPRPVILVTFLAAAFATVAYAEQTCLALAQSAREVAPGVVLQWDSSFLCANAPDSDTYKIEVRVWHIGGNDSATIEQMLLTHKTPRPRGRTPAGMKTGDTLPITVSSGGATSFVSTGTYVLAETDEGKKANHHYQAAGVSESGGETFSLGINVRFRAPGVAEE